LHGGSGGERMKEAKADEFMVEEITGF